MAFYPVIERVAGINNKLDTKSVKALESGHVYVAEAVNLDIDDNGAASVRNGQISLSSVPSHSCFCDGGDYFVAQDRTSDTALYQVDNGFALTGIRSGLTKGARISFFQQGKKTFYAHGYQNGVITLGVSAAWPIATYYGPDTLKEFTSAPVGTHIAYHLGRAWIAVENVIYCSEPFKPGLFRMAKYFFQFGTDVRMIRPVAGGVWVSDSETTGFIANAENWDGQKYSRTLEYPAHEWSDNQRLVDLSGSRYQVPGMSAVWSSDKGLHIGTPDGQLLNVTADNLFYPSGASGATVVDGQIVINSVY